MRCVVACLLMITLWVGCSSERKPGPPATAVPRTTAARSTLPPDTASPIGQLIAFLQSKGFSGEYVALPSTSVAGAGQSGSFKGKGFAVTFYHFADANLASSVAADGIRDRQCYANGTLVMEVAMADEAFVQAFLAYQQSPFSLGDFAALRLALGRSGFALRLAVSAVQRAYLADTASLFLSWLWLARVVHQYQ